MCDGCRAIIKDGENIHCTKCIDRMHKAIVRTVYCPKCDKEIQIRFLLLIGDGYKCPYCRGDTFILLKDKGREAKCC